jgi:hypothetical protein
LEAGLEVEYAPDSVGFHWAGYEEGDQVEGEDKGTVQIVFELDRRNFVPPLAFTRAYGVSGRSSRPD